MTVFIFFGSRGELPRPPASLKAWCKPWDWVCDMSASRLEVEAVARAALFPRESYLIFTCIVFLVVLIFVIFSFIVWIWFTCSIC